MTSAPRFAALLAGLLCLCSTALHAQTLDPQLTAMRDAIAAAERGQSDPAQLTALNRHPLYGWLEFATLKRSIDTVSNAQAQSFLQRYAGQPVAESFRSTWLPAVARRQDWTTLLANWKNTDNTGLRCAHLTARQATGRMDAQWSRDALGLWRNGKVLPDACEPVIAALDARGDLTPALRWERVEAAADGQLPAVMRTAARGLPAADLALATDYAAFLDNVHARALGWPRTERSRRIAVDGLAKLAKSDPDAAEQQLPPLASALGFSDAQRGQVLYQIALWTVASYLPDSARRLNAVPDGAYDERLHEWRAREAMARGDWPAALAAIRKMPASQRADSRWQYFEARLTEKTGAAAAAQPLYRAAAQSPTFHGFLAADRVQQPYRLCPWEPKDSPQAKAAVARDPALMRAIALFQIDRPGWAVAEWNDAASRFDDTQRRLAVEVASDNGWFDRAVFALGKQPDEQRLYSLRFPLHHDDSIRREAAKNAIDPAWVAAEIRAESIFNPRARSPANAMGLMQVLPGTGAAVAKGIALPGYAGAASLYEPDTNIAIGTAYLRQLLNTYGLPYLTIAAYNAGPAPTGRWLSQRPGFEPDFWIETISYKETRDYVARVLAFSVIYDWQLNGDMLPLSDRLMGKLVDKRQKPVCAPGQGPSNTAQD
ncbi:transglycosylase SLT domain-containing protein [Xanthomonas cannabis]|uniref:Soluble lytic murein transglycosylase n=1 Tax=Xanthomonas cannabis TaxID=1885674 RepID=A0ABR6JFD4_9XANT|nr:transglycosylase SLT domain-containing protein [Xanthomonas cannabis]MBB4591499.1 soluble lytic murein transglycosylase [Xanthomonas cannabis]MBB5521286.1 soluble lytic murein transglycosylase [Xanthomonas cannabis]